MRFPGLFLASAATLLVANVPPSVPTPPSVPEIGAPELAALGPDGAGVMVRQVIDKDQLDPLASLEQGKEVHADRALTLRIWYPARTSAKAVRATYTASLVGEPGTPPATFGVPALAVQDAPAAGKGYPVVLLSHGYNNDPVMLSWLAENLATKGYVVVAPEHRDPPITDVAKSPATLLRRPLDITFVLSRLRAGLLGDLVDTGRIALVGYSFGGYGVLTVAGGSLSATSPAVSRLPAPLVATYTAGGARDGQLHDPAIKAVVAISPAGGAPWNAWGAQGLDGIHAPLLMLAGSYDRTVGYENGPAAIFANAHKAERTMLTFRSAGHSIGTNPAPAAMRDRLWDFDWFEDPIWRKSRINAISEHFITAFLDRYVKGDEARAAYFAVPGSDAVKVSDKAGWIGPFTPYAAVSAGGDNPTWKGFVRGHQDGLELRHLSVQP
ncbi:alpha/beta hydrolase family protein [Novosphingobium sp.]|uniref:alpha/beta hydrolase family protein n=1 Tax=Novosphingobium sp. TaxID=1874826 RepID=UPI0038BD48B3